MPFGQPFGQRFVNPMSFEEWLEWQGLTVNTAAKLAYQEYVKHYNDDLTIENFEKGL
jgi:hypothetical protein